MTIEKHTLIEVSAFRVLIRGVPHWIISYRMEDVDLPSVPESTHQKQSLLIDKARESEREQELMAENSRLQARVSTLVKVCLHINPFN